MRRAVSKTEGTFLNDLFLEMPVNCVLQSTWREFPFYDIEWGAALDGRMMALRPLAVGVSLNADFISLSKSNGSLTDPAPVKDSSILSSLIQRAFLYNFSPVE